MRTPHLPKSRRLWTGALLAATAVVALSGLTVSGALASTRVVNTVSTSLLCRQQARSSRQAGPVDRSSA